MRLFGRFVTKVETATLIIAITGLPSAMGTWAPFALARIQLSALTTLPVH